MYFLWLVYFYHTYIFNNRQYEQRIIWQSFLKRLSKFKFVDLEKCAEEFFNSRLTSKFIKEIHDMVFYFRDNGISVILLLGTIDSLIKNYSEYFKVPYESIKVTNNNGYVKVDYSNFDNHKIDFVKKFNPEETVTIADSKHDLEILKYSKYSIVVAIKRIKPWMQQLENAHIIQIK